MTPSTSTTTRRATRWVHDGGWWESIRAVSRTDTCNSPNAQDHGHKRGHGHGHGKGKGKEATKHHHKHHETAYDWDEDAKVSL